LARIERLERRIGLGGESAAPAAAPAASAPAAKVSPVAAATSAPVGIPALTTAAFRDSWQAILSRVEKASKSAWIVAYTLKVVDFTDDVLTLRFMSQSDLESFKSSGQAPDVLRKAINEELGITVKFKPQVETAAPTTPIKVVEVPAVVEAAAAVQALSQPEAEEKPAKATKSRKLDIPDDQRYGAPPTRGAKNTRQEWMPRQPLEPSSTVKAKPASGAPPIILMVKKFAKATERNNRGRARAWRDFDCKENRGQSWLVFDQW
jgi:DNA polymerase-3 subunit gamma/tau